MANTTVNSNLQVVKYRPDYFREYVRANWFSPYFGMNETMPIHIKEDRGPTVRIPLLVRMTGNGVTGSQTLRGNGEQIDQYHFDLAPTYYRNAAEFDKERLEQPSFDLYAAAKPQLMDWSLNLTRDHIIQGLGAIQNSGTYANLEDATEANRDGWLVANADRQIFGASAGSGTDHSADLGQIDSTNDTFTYSRLDDMRRLAEDADPHIRPFRTDQESEVYVCFAGSIAFRDLKNSLTTINSNADVRGMGGVTRGRNILARAGDLFWNGVIVRKIPEITKIFSATGKTLATAGASSIAVEPVFLCGAQAVGWGMGQRPMTIEDTDYDYNFQPGCAVELKHDIKKMFFNNIQHGVVTGYFSGAA